MDIKISIVLKDQTYGFSDLLDGRKLNQQTKEEIIELIKEDIGYVFDQQIEVEQLTMPIVRKSFPLIEGKTKSNIKKNKEKRQAPPPPPIRTIKGNVS